MNWLAVGAIYKYEMARTFRTLLQSLVAPVVSTSLYFVVFGTAIGSRIETVEGVPYGAFIVPGLIMLTVLMQSISNASFGIYFPKFIGTIYEVLSAPISFLEIVAGYVGAAATKSFIIGLIIYATANLFVALPVAHPLAALGFLALTCLSFSLFGFIIGIWAKNFEQLQLVPLLVVSPLVFLGGAFYSISMLPPALADDHPLQPGRLPHLRLPLGLLRDRRRRRRPQPRRHPPLHPRLPRRRLVDLPHRLAHPQLTRSARKRLTARPAPPRPPATARPRSRRDSSARGFDSPASSR